MQGAELVAIESFVAAVALTMPRLLAVFIVTPIFSGQMITGMTRNGLILLLAIFLSPVAGSVSPETLPAAKWLLIVGKEAMIGIMLGLGFGIFIWAIQSVGDLIDFQTGSSNAHFFDPVAGHENGPTGEFFTWLVIALFISAGGLLAMLDVLMDSYKIWPITSFFPDIGLVLEQFAIRQGDTLFMWIIKLAAPVIFILLLVEIGMGLASRVTPQLNVFVFSQPLKSLLSILMILLFLFFVYESLQEFLRPDNSVLEFLRSTL
jgi:type III secretion protein T